jgi:hypothetical protein
VVLAYLAVATAICYDFDYTYVHVPPALSTLGINSLFDSL